MSYATALALAFISGHLIGHLIWIIAILTVFRRLLRAAVRKGSIRIDGERFLLVNPNDELPGNKIGWQLRALFERSSEVARVSGVIKPNNPGPIHVHYEDGMVVTYYPVFVPEEKR